MTKAQFQLYLGRYNKAAESLIHAIETSQPHQVTVLQKVCSAVQDRARSEELNEACKNLGNPEARKAKAEKTATTQPANVESKPAQSTTPSAMAQSTNQAAPQTSATKPADEKSSWQLQLGAFSVKSNADLLVNNLKKRNIACTISQNTLESGKTLYIVRTGPFDTKESAVDYGAKKLAPLNVEFRPMLIKQAL